MDESTLTARTALAPRRGLSLILATASLCLVTASAIDAATLSANMPVSATVGGATGACSSLSASSLTFGTVAASANGNATSTVTLTCAAGTAYSLSAEGSLPACAGTTEAFFLGPATTSNTNFPVYILYKDAAHATPLGPINNVGCGSATPLTGTGTGAAQALTIFGVVSGSGGPTATPAGSYSDVATIQVSF